MTARVFAIGTGWTDCVKPPSRLDWDYRDMLHEADIADEQIAHVAGLYRRNAT